MRLDEQGRVCAGLDPQPFSRPAGMRDFGWWDGYDQTAALMRPDDLAAASVLNASASPDRLAGRVTVAGKVRGKRAKSARRYRFGGDMTNPDRIEYVRSMVRLRRCESLRVRVDGTPTAQAETTVTRNPAGKRVTIRAAVRVETAGRLSTIDWASLRQAAGYVGNID